MKHLIPFFLSFTVLLSACSSKTSLVETVSKSGQKFAVVNYDDSQKVILPLKQYEAIENALRFLAQIFNERKVMQGKDRKDVLELFVAIDEVDVRKAYAVIEDQSTQEEYAYTIQTYRNIITDLTMMAELVGSIEGNKDNIEEYFASILSDKSERRESINRIARYFPNVPFYYEPIVEHYLSVLTKNLQELEQEISDGFELDPRGIIGFHLDYAKEIAKEVESWNSLVHSEEQQYVLSQLKKKIEDLEPVVIEANKRVSLFNTAFNEIRETVRRNFYEGATAKQAALLDLKKEFIENYGFTTREINEMVDALILDEGWELLSIMKTE